MQFEFSALRFGNWLSNEYPSIESHGAVFTALVGKWANFSGDRKIIVRKQIPFL